jgi:hypothetical protein
MYGNNYLGRCCCFSLRLFCNRRLGLGYGFIFLLNLGLHKMKYRQINGDDGWIKFTNLGRRLTARRARRRLRAGLGSGLRYRF